MKILILKRDKIGDLLLTTPLLRHLRTALPRAEIHVLANDYNAWVLHGNRDVDRLWVYPRARHGGRARLGAVLRQVVQTVRLRREGFDAVIIAGGEESARAIKRGAWLGARRRIAYCDSPMLRRYLTDPLPTPHATHEVERMLGLLAPLGIPAPKESPTPTFSPPAQWCEDGRRWLAEYAVPNAFIVIGLGARKSKKQPSAAQVLRWAAYAKERHGLDTVFMWTPGRAGDPLYPGDDDVAAPVVARRPPYLHPCREGLPVAIGILWRARAAVFPDSGLMHLAAASPSGVVGLFATASQSPAQWGPRGPRAHALVGEGAVENLEDAALFAALDRLVATAEIEPG